MPSCPLSPTLQGRILQLYDEEYKIREIGDKLNVPKSTVYDTIMRFKKHHTTHDLPRSGRPRSITDRTRRQVIRTVKKNCTLPYRDIGTLAGNIPERQVRFIAAEAGYRCRVACRKPFLSSRTVQLRLEWACSHRTMDWDHVIWTDEMSIELGEQPLHRRVTRLPGEELLLDNIQPTFRSGRQSLMVWGAIANG